MTKSHDDGVLFVFVKRLVFQFVCYALIVRGQAISQADQRLGWFNEDHNGWHWSSIFEWPFQAVDKSYSSIVSPMKQSKPSVRNATPFFFYNREASSVNNSAKLEPIDEIENYIYEPQTIFERVTRSAACTAEGFFHIENDCKRFYRCVRNGDGVGNKAFTKFEFSCGEGTVWDPDSTACNHPWAVQRPDCTNSVDGDDNAYNTGGGSDLSGNGDGDASQNRDNSAASDPQNGDVGRPSAYSDLGANPSTESNVKQRSCTADGFFAVARNCKKFVRCVNNGYGGYTEYEFDCAEGTVWDVDTTTCNFPYAVRRQDCNNDSNNLGQTTDDENSMAMPTTKVTPASNDQYSSTSSQYAANNGIDNGATTVGQQTPSTMPNQPSAASSTNQPQTSSTIPGQQPATNRPASGPSQQTWATDGQNANTTGTTPVTANEHGHDVCTSEGFFPSSQSCQKFYRCVNFGGAGYTKYEFNCGPGTVWDPSLNTCNHPWAVNDERCRSASAGDGSGTDASPTWSSSSSSPPPYSVSSTTPTDQSRPASNESPNSTKPPASSSPYPTTPTIPSRQNSTANTTKPTISTASTTANPASTRPSGTNQQSTTTDASSTTTDGAAAATNKPQTCNNVTGPPSSKRTDKIKCEKAGFYPHPQNCKKFYRCVDWDGDKGQRFSVFHFDCPAGTIFDPSLNICNHENSVYPPRDCTGGDDANAAAAASADNDSNQSTCVPENSTPMITPTTNRPETTTAGNDGSSNGTTTDAANTESTTSESNNGSSSSPPPTTTVVSTTNVANTEATTDSVQTTTTKTTTEAVTSITESTMSSIGSTPTTDDADEMSTTTTTQQSSNATTTPAMTTTTSSTDDDATTTISTTPAATTQTEMTTTMASTTISPTESPDKCPDDIDENQFVFVCPTAFRRHPKYCDVFYQCTETKPGEIKVLTFSCANGTIYDADKVQCLPPDKVTDKCDAKMMAASGSGRSNEQMPTSGDSAILPLTSTSKSFCPAQGSFPYANDCSLFIKCSAASQGGKLNAYVYQCPEGYVYYNVSKRCEKMNKVPCEGGKRLSSLLRSAVNATAPVEMKNIGH